MLVSGPRRWSAAELAADVAAAADWLHLAGIPAGGRVAIAVPDPADQLIWALATDRVGAAAAVLDPRWPAAQRRGALDQLDPAVVVEHPARRRRDADAPARQPGAGWVTFTSGSSGVPRAVERTRASWTASYPALTRLTGLSDSDTVLVAGPLSSSMVAFACLHTLAAGARLVLLTRWDPAAADDAGTTVVHLVPTMLGDLLDRPARRLRPRLVVSAGAKLDPALERRARAAWPGVDVLEYYGSSEQSFVTARLGGDPTTVGAQFPGVRLEIRDDGGRVQPAGTGGEIWTLSPYAGAGGRLREQDGWFTVGDRGRLDAAGVLTLLGREQILTGGTTVQPAAVEAVLRAADGVRDAVVLGLPHPRLGELVVAVIDGDGDLAALRRHARLRLAAAQLPRRWYAVEAMPRTGTGKPARGELLAAVQDGTLRPLQVTASRVDQIEERWNQRFPSTLENHGPQHQE